MIAELLKEVTIFLEEIDKKINDLSKLYGDA